MAKETTITYNAQLTFMLKRAHYPTPEEAAAFLKALLKAAEIDDAVVSDVKVFVNEGETETGMWTPKPEVIDDAQQTV